MDTYSLYKPIILLSLLSIGLTEIITTSTKISDLTHSTTWFFLFMGYMIPVICIREWSVRNNMGIVSIFMIGILFGIYNEGLLAQTFFTNVHSPIDIFANYGIVSGIRIPWSLTITFWQGLQAIVYPISITYLIFPKVSHDPWLQKSTTWILWGICSMFSLLVFFGTNITPVGEKMLHLFYLWVTSMILYLISIKTKDYLSYSKTVSMNASWRYICFWMLMYFLISLIPLLLCKWNISPIIYVLYFIVFSSLFLYRYHSISRISYENMGLIALWWSFLIALFTISITLPFGLKEQGYTAISMALLILIGWLLILRKNKGFRSQKFY